MISDTILIGDLRDLQIEIDELKQRVKVLERLVLSDGK
jgi:hypothetical protein